MTMANNRHMASKETRCPQCGAETLYFDKEAGTWRCKDAWCSWVERRAKS